MKAFLCLVVVLAFGFKPALGSLRIDGTPIWSITKPDATLEVVGAIENTSTASAFTGPIKLALWATPGTFPFGGRVLAEAEVGRLFGGGRVLDFSETVSVDMQDLTGDFQLTMVLMEFVGGTWFNRVAVPSGSAKLDRGDFLDDRDWRVPSRGYKRPKRLKAGQKLKLNTKANGSFTRIIGGTEAPLHVQFTSDENASLKRGSSSGFSTYSYKRGRDSIRGRRFRTGRLSLFSGDVRDAEIVLFFRNARKGVFKLTGGGRVVWGTFRLRR